MADRPNLFSYATKELSQDAFICWLIDWAGVSQCKGPEDEALRQCGRGFVDALFAKWEGYEVELGDEILVEILRQEKKIDVLVRVNGRYVLLIEDKTDSGTHGNQLEEYWRTVVRGETRLKEAKEDDVFPIYLKTGNHSILEANRIQNTEGYMVFDRSDFLRVLDGYSGNNSILLDYRQYLQSLEDRTNSYANWTAASEQDDPLALQGLYSLLERKFLEPRGNKGKIYWGYVENRKFGGFTGVNWRPSEVNKEAGVWLQVNDDGRIELVFRLHVRNKQWQRARLRNWHAAIMSVGGRSVAKPARLVSGEYMTVAIWTTDAVAFGEDGRFDFSGTVQNLRKAERVLKEASLQLTTH
ncbi:MAG: PD-(D/E)XK nuclease family protein [Gammaproteobacteria bacterium]|nr:PD-(D/E)XK nuclease family protein [Gammaproteobacteria bacterium]